MCVSVAVWHVEWFLFDFCKMKEAKKLLLQRFCETNVRVLVWLGWRWRLSLAPFIAGDSLSQSMLRDWFYLKWNEYNEMIKDSHLLFVVGQWAVSCGLLLCWFSVTSSKEPSERKVLSIYSQMLFTHQTQELRGLPLCNTQEKHVRQLLGIYILDGVQINSNADWNPDMK